MTARDELADIISRAISQDCPSERDMLDAADQILARWRLVPVEQDGCQPCTDLRTERIKLYYRGFSDRQIAERQGMSTRTIAAWRRKSGLQYNDGKQHRAADELTQHDQATGIYESHGIVYCGECNERLTRGHARGCHSTDQHGPHED